MLSDQLPSGWGKLATAAAVLVAGVGAAGVGAKVVAGAATGRPATRRPRSSAPAPRRRATRAATAARDARHDRPAEDGDQEVAQGRSRRQAAPGAEAVRRQWHGGPLPVGLSAGDTCGGGATGSGGRKALPKLKLPAGGHNPIAPVQKTVEDAVEGVVEGVRPWSTA